MKFIVNLHLKNVNKKKFCYFIKTQNINKCIYIYNYLNYPIINVSLAI